MARKGNAPVFVYVSLMCTFYRCEQCTDSLCRCMHHRQIAKRATA